MKRFFSVLLVLFLVPSFCILSSASTVTTNANLIEVPWARPTNFFVSVASFGNASHTQIVVNTWEFLVFSNGLSATYDYSRDNYGIEANLAGNQLTVTCNWFGTYSSSFPSWFYATTRYRLNNNGTGTLFEKTQRTVTAQTATILSQSFNYGVAAIDVSSDMALNSAESTIDSFISYNSSNAVNSIVSKLDSLINIEGSIQSGVSSANAKLTSLNGKIDDTNEKFDTALDLIEGSPISDYVPETNADLNEYESAEGDLLGDNFDSLEDFEPEPFNPSAGSLGSAFTWLKSELEFATGNSKLRTSILVVLSLSLVAFLLKIYV